ncbi:MAG: type II toxin-antitoxin system RelB/DinJ family antitoxin [Lachnospiraceae bacterium]|jgi:DNA-damage-inducible protein J|nr:type II toxin-antitoxin system RelB/DinJ family antitoxin [Lachnospiraceae bacterium]
MAGTSNVTIRIDKDLKEQVEILFSEMGMTLTTALNIFMRQSLRQGKIPFEISVNTPNAITLAAMQEIEDMRNGKLPKKSQCVEDFIAEMEE